MSFSAPIFPEGTICQVYGQQRIVEVLNCTWSPLSDDCWLVRDIKTSDTLRVWGLNLIEVSPMEALALMAD